MCAVHPHRSLDALGEQEALIDGVDSVIRQHITLPLQQDRSSVQSIICPEHSEPAFLVTMDECPESKHEGNTFLSIICDLFT